MERRAVWALVLAVAVLLAAPAQGQAANAPRGLAQVRAQTKALKAQVQALKVKTNTLRLQAEALEALTKTLEAQTHALEEKTGALKLDLDTVVTRNPVSSLNNWITAGSGVVPLTLQGAPNQLDIQRWLTANGETVARVSPEGFLYASSLYSNESLNLLGTSSGGVSGRQPLVNYWNNDELRWQTGLDSANSENDDFVLAGRGRPGGGVFDVLYLKDYYPDGSVAIGMGLAPPFPGFRTQIGSPDDSDWGALMLRLGENSTGDPLRVIDSAGKRLLSVDTRGRLVPADGEPLRVLGDLRVRSTDIEDPSGLHLNGNPTDTSTDFRIRNLFDPELSTYVLQILTTDGRVFAEIRQDTGEVFVRSGRIGLGSGTLVEEEGALSWIGSDGTVTVLAGG